MIGAADLIGRLGVFSFRWAKTILAFSLIFFLGSAWFSKDLRFDTISLALDVEDPEMKACTQSLNKFGDSKHSPRSNVNQRRKLTPLG